ncbi:MAG: tetratricopeptide repeat protein [Deltaproteobacteria bacterium]|nr:MAG: tetratricopeptide repeat protein [Deltaproteobacteria bacterium]
MEGEGNGKTGGGMGKRLKEWIAGSILMAIVAALGLGAHARNSFWKSEIGLWEDGVKKAPQKERPHHNLGFAYYEAGRWEDAQKELEKALALNPRYTLSMYNLGLVFYRKGRMEKAIECCRKTLDLKSPPPETYFNLGLAYYQKGHYSNAVKSFKALLEIKPDYQNTYNNLGLAYQRQRQWRRAIESFQEELRRDPENPYPLLYLGDLYIERKDYRRALVHFKRALASPSLSEERVNKVKKIISAIEETPGISPASFSKSPLAPLFQRGVIPPFSKGRAGGIS